MVTTMLRLIAAMLIGLSLSTMPALAATKVLVNGVPISDTEISSRVKLLALEGGGNSQKATQQLIDEQIQLQEARRLNITISEQDVDGAFQQVAKNVNLSPDKLDALLRQRGISQETMKQRLRAALAWQRIAAMVVQPRVQVSDLQLDQEASAQLGQDLSFDYILKEILFISTAGNASARTGQANKYRSSFQGCDSAVQLSLNYTDAAVRDMGRRHATQLPEAIAKELAGLNVGGITKPRVVDTGVSMLAICQKTQAEDLTFIKSDLENKAGSAALEGEVATYLADLRKSAKIIYN